MEISTAMVFSKTFKESTKAILKMEKRMALVYSKTRRECDTRASIRMMLKSAKEK